MTRFNVRSMTGFGQADAELSGCFVHIDVKSVNHRFCEVTVRLPRELQSLEEPLKKTVQQAARRGRFDVFVTMERSEAGASGVDIDWALAQAYAQAADELKQRLGLPGELGVKELLQIPDIVRLRSEQTNEEETARVLRGTLETALTRLTAMRETEGAHLASDLDAKLTNLESARTAVAALAPQVVKDYADKLRERIRELLQGEALPDEQRLAAEVALMADRSNIDEELTRLDSHIRQFRQLLQAGDSVGRKLDFLIQEMNRETNTIGSKAARAEITRYVIEMKAELEKMREQVQNIE